MRELLVRSKSYFLVLTIAAIVMRLFFVLKFPVLSGDTWVYGDIAKNWLQHGVFGLEQAGEIVPTYIRLPGYPAFLSGIFAVFGHEHYSPVLYIQILFDTATCFIVADLARRTVSDRAARIAFLLAALCPFLANYVATGLTETLAIFFAALALNEAVRGLDSVHAKRPWLWHWIGCGMALGAGILLRPDGGILLIAIGGYLLVRMFYRSAERKQTFLALVVVGAVALATLVPWTARNWKVFHRFQPIAPRYANAPDEVVPMGFERWVKTWMVDYVSVPEIYWSIDGHNLDIDKLPNRAFDSVEQRRETAQVFDAYNESDPNEPSILPDVDAQFAKLAEERIHGAPLRYYVWLPALRIADMWLRPRTEMIGTTDRWWEFSADPSGSAIAVSLGLLNLLYLGAATAGLITRRWVRYSGMLLTFVIVRSLFLGTLENPEPRYTLECYPVILVFGAAALAGLRPRTAKAEQEEVAAAKNLGVS